MEGSSGSLWGHKSWQKVFSHMNSGWMQTSWILGTETWPHPTAYRLQCWEASGQTTNRVGTWPINQQTGCLKNSRAHKHVCICPLTQPYPPECQDPAPYTSAPPNRKPAQDFWSMLPTRGANTRSKKTTVLQLAERRPQTGQNLPLEPASPWPLGDEMSMYSWYT